MTEKKRVFVVEISPVVADDGSTQKFLFSTKAFGTLSTDTPPNTRVRNCLRNPGTFTRNLFANARVTGVITPDYGNIILANRVPEKGGPGELDDWVDYGLAGSVVNVYWGVPGDAYPSAWTFVYTAFCHSFVADATEVVLRLRDQLQLLDQPLVAESFAGTGGLEGTGGVSKPKQWVSGDPGFIEPILLDVNKQIYFVQSTGTYLASPTALTDTSDSAWGLFEGGSRLTHDGLTPYASLDQLQTVEPPSGKFRYYLGPSNPLLSGWYDGPVYFRLGTPPVTDLRVFPIGVPSSTDMIAWGGAYGSFTVPNLAIKAGVSREDVDTDHAIGVTSRLVNDSTSYLEVMADSALSEQGWFGFNRLGVFHSGHLLDPADNEFYYGISSGAGIPAPASNPTTSLHTFDADKVLNLRREPVAGMEVPIWNVTLNAGDTWPSALVTGVSPQMKDYLTRTPKWLTTSGVSSSTLLANPGAAKDIVEIHSRVLQNSFSCRLWLERYFVLYGGRRHFFTFTVPMSDALLALDMHDVVTLRGSRYGLSAGKKFRVISLTLDCSTPVPHITYGLWGGTAGQYTGAIGGGTGGGGGGGGGGSGVDIGTTLPSRQLGDFTGSMIGTVSVSDVNPPPYADPNCSLYYNNMKAFIEFNGTAGATSFADSGPQGLTLTGTATYAALDTTIKKFGSASLKILSLTSDGASIANTSALGNTAGQPISIQCWFYVDVWPASGVAQLFDLYNSAGSTGAWVGFRGTSGNLRLTWNFGAGGSPTGSIVISMNAWHHMALEDPGDGSVTLYLDGVIDSTFVASTFSRATSNKLCIGGYHAYGAATSASGEEFYVDAFEYVSGHQVYLSTFTPPTSPTYALQCIANGASELSQVGVMGDFTGYMEGTVTSPPGLSWTARDSSRNWFGVASNSDGTILVATVTSGLIYRSTDSGVTWASPGGSSLAWWGICSSSDGTKLAAVVDAGQIYTSTDSGANWTARDSNRGWRHIGCSADGATLVACVYGGQIYNSTDSGATWTARDSSRNWNGIACSSDGTKWVATVDGGQLYVSTDSGVTWAAKDSNRNWRSVASSSDGSKLVAAVFSGQLYTSTDSGANWTARDSSRGWIGVASSSDGVNLAATVVSGNVYISTDSGVTWTPRASTQGWRMVTGSSDLSVLLAAAWGGQIYTSP